MQQLSFSDGKPYCMSGGALRAAKCIQKIIMTKQKLRKLSEVSENIAILSLREIN
jgi:hypothetical protein